ncbi:hypothetical protein PFISCL1PPCAC_20607, partial [Pristionchus fissidentatus]
LFFSLVRLPAVPIMPVSPNLASLKKNTVDGIERRKTIKQAPIVSNCPGGLASISEDFDEEMEEEQASIAHSVEPVTPQSPSIQSTPSRLPPIHEMEEEDEEEEALEIGDSEEIEEAPFTPNAGPLTPETTLDDYDHFDSAPLYTPPPPPMEHGPSRTIRFFDREEYESAVTDTEDDGVEERVERSAVHHPSTPPYPVMAHYEFGFNPFDLNEESEEEDLHFDVTDVPYDVRYLIFERLIENALFHNERFVAAAAQPRQMQQMDKEQREQRIKELREENEQSSISPPRFSRSCDVCYTESPRQRSVFIRCGHTTCSACALQIADGSSLLTCPFCREETEFIKLFEAEMEQGKEENEKVPTQNQEVKKDTAEASRPKRPRLFRRAVKF